MYNENFKLLGHNILKCDYCESFVMEGHNAWICDCGAICNAATKWIWKNKTLKELYGN